MWKKTWIQKSLSLFYIRCLVTLQFPRLRLHSEAQARAGLGLLQQLRKTAEKNSWEISSILAKYTRTLAEKLQNELISSWLVIQLSVGGEVERTKDILEDLRKIAILSMNKFIQN